MDNDSQTELEGQIERITYFSEETGFTVARLKVQGSSDPVTVVGSLIAPTPGEILMLKGSWLTHPKFGRQFKIESHRTKVPATVDGIRRYLGSRLIKGIGPVMASRIVKRFGKETLEVIEHRIGELEKVEGIGRKRIEMIEKAWSEQKEIREVMIFLQEYGIGTGYATKIFKRYGRDSVSVITKNPYRLATEIFGIGFLSADKIAGKIGFEKSAPVRVEAGILYVMQKFTEEGHVYYPYDPLIEKCQEILEVEREIVVNAFGTIAFEKKIVLEDLNQDLEGFQANHKAVYLHQLYTSETGIAKALTRLIASPKKVRKMDEKKAVAWVQKRIHLTLATRQVEAVERAISEKVMVITGGPGTGKTTIINAVIKIYQKVGAKIHLAAPTGRAAKRMSEATGYPAKTIHRMLEFSPKKWKFLRDQDHPLDADVLILDEVSMIDTTLMASLLKGIPLRATLIMVGDANQLPSVGAGNVLKDTIRSGAVPVVELKEIFRQAKESRIIVNAHKINQGIIPKLKRDREQRDDFYFISQEDPEQVLKIIIDLVCERIPRRFHLDALEDIQVLSPMHKGNVGTENLNNKLQEVLNPTKEELSRGGKKFRPKDKVMQVRNNYDKEVFNGDIGRIVSIDQENQQVIVSFDNVLVPYDYSELDEIILAYAISVHKSQGSEYRAIVVPVLSQHFVLLQRNLVYTAVTRGKDLWPI
jgi:exodeoxyribonuclease V alpha subunit